MASSTPLTASEYQSMLKYGFTTHYFKVLDIDRYEPVDLDKIYEKGFRHLRLRSRSDLEGFNMTAYLINLNTVVDDCLARGILPVISWIHHEAEAFGTPEHKAHFVWWWNETAIAMKDKDYRLSFNLFTELGVDKCRHTTCNESLVVNTDKYNEWTYDVVQKIRNSGGNNDKRIIILTAPKKWSKDLNLISNTIYDGDGFMMVEWHLYAAGPNKNPGAKKYWEGDGTVIGRANVDYIIELANNFTKDTGLPTYLGAWMPIDNSQVGALNQTEVLHFARYFIRALRPIPWSLNTFFTYYDSRSNTWKTFKNFGGQDIYLDVVLDTIVEAMLAP